jgi:hypothetical protein
MAARLRHVSEIPATPEQVWAVLTDLEGWKTWNPTLVEPRGELREGSVVRMKLRLGRVSMPMKQKIVELTPPSALRWQSRFGPAWLFLVTRTFHLERVDETGTRLEQSEEGTGLLARLIFVFTGPPTVRGYVAISEALAGQVGH